MKIFNPSCAHCHGDFVLGMKIVGLDTGEEKIFPLHDPCAREIMNEPKPGFVMSNNKNQRKMTRLAQELGKEKFEERLKETYDRKQKKSEGVAL